MISVIIPCYNAERNIKKCIASIQKQSYNDLEIIVIDDGSIDDTAFIVNELSNKDARIKYHFQKNKGVSEARNHGLSHAKGDYISFVDSDDTINIFMLEKLLNNMNDTDSILSVCGINRESNKDSKSPYQPYRVMKSEIFDEILNDDNISGYVWNKLFRKDIINEFELTMNSEIHFMEDLLFCLEYCNSVYDYNIVVTEELLYNYNNLNETITSMKFSSKRLSGYKTLEQILDFLGRNKDVKKYTLNKYYTYYALFLVSNIVNGKNESTISEKEFNLLEKKIEYLDTKKINGFKIKLSVMLVRNNFNIYYFLWKLLKI